MYEVSLIGILDEIHDHYLDLEEISFIEGILFIPISDTYGTFRKQKLVFGRCMQIRHVMSWSFEDHAHVGYFDINKFFYDNQSKEIVIICSIPLEIRAQVTNIEVILDLAEPSPRV